MKCKSKVELYHGDCLKVLWQLQAQSIDAIIDDLPYGKTACKWDSVIPFEPMWAGFEYVAKRKAAIVLFGSQPFTSALVMSKKKWFKYCWVWNKITARGHLVAKIRPMQQSEDIAVFGNGKIAYYPIMTPRDKSEVARECKRTDIMGGKSDGYTSVRNDYYPKNIITFSTVGTSVALHPTQKPVALLEYLVKTYTNEGDTVLDATMGSGTTGVACVNTGRNFIGIELGADYFKIAQERIEKARQEIAMRLL